MTSKSSSGREAGQSSVGAASSLDPRREIHLTKQGNRPATHKSKIPVKVENCGVDRRKRFVLSPLPKKPSFDHLKQMEGPTDIYDRFHLYVFPERFVIEPRDRDGGLASDSYLNIDRDSDKLSLIKAAENPVPITEAETKKIHGIVGMIKLVSGYALITIKQALMMGRLNGHEIWLIKEIEVLPFKRTTLHLTEKQVFHCFSNAFDSSSVLSKCIGVFDVDYCNLQKWYERNFVDMIHLVLSTSGFYYSTSFDLSHSLQWLDENATPMFKQLPMMGRSDERFVWNRYLCAPIAADPSLYRYALPVIHGFFSSNRCIIGEKVFQLFLISRRSVHRAGTRFYMRGVSSEGYSANFVETEQIVQFDKNGDPRNRHLTAFIQVLLFEVVAEFS
ncbi:unnamed protein product [Anisakis simplex]|uniref:Phosphatidylinositol-3-phosphatase SAC1 n=1 Tax=Anisakis simplex TaxID=6269 RepID=A0A158PPN2_ANISI|nr:unnamed protein product [Anisakis simplex]